MKSFLSTFVVCLILCVIGLFILGGLLSGGGVWPIIILIALLLTILARTIASLDARIKLLEKKLGLSNEQKQSDPVVEIKQDDAEINSADAETSKTGISDAAHSPTEKTAQSNTTARTTAAGSAKTTA